MAKIKKAVAKKKVVKEAPVVELSPAQAKFKALIETYAVQNPAKYELKKEQLEAQLNLIK